MTDEPAPSPPPSDPALQVAAPEAVAKAEAAATRRRWINLGEFVAIAGLLIAGVSLWLNWSDRRHDLADKQAEKRAEARYEIKAAVDSDESVRISGDERHTLGDVSVAFPAALGIGTRSSPTQTIPRDWYQRAVLSVSDGGADNRTGTLPVLLTVQYFDGDTPLAARGVYDIVWTTKGHGLFGRTLRVVSVKRRAARPTQAEIDRLWVASRTAH